MMDLPLEFRIFIIPILLLFILVMRHPLPCQLLVAVFSCCQLAAIDRNFLQSYCYECHDADVQKGGLDLEALPDSLDDTKDFKTWELVHDRLAAGEMPPKEKAAKVPQSRLKQFHADLASNLYHADSGRQRTFGRTPLRRLNRTEYENTMRDLFDLPGLQVKDKLPEDGRIDGFEKGSAALDISSVQLRKYIEAADFVLDEAIAHEAKPMVFKERFRRIGGLAQFFEATFPIYDKKVDLDFIESVYPKPGSGKNAMGLREKQEFLKDMDSIGLLTHVRPSWNAEIGNFSPFHSGFYKIRTSLWSYFHNLGKVEPGKRHQSVCLTADGRLLCYFDAPSLDAQEHEITVWLNAGERLELNPANLWGNYNRAYNYEGHVVAVDYVDIEGPLHEGWPPKSHQRLFGDLPLAKIPFIKDGQYPRQPPQVVRHPGSRPNHTDGDEFKKWQPVWTAASSRPLEDATILLADFLPRAFRRPVEPDEVETYAEIARKEILAGAFFEDAMRKAYRTALCSPDFLFFRELPGEGSPSDPMALNPQATANRLAYFLWNSTPDDTLLEAASRRQIYGKHLTEQIDRMLGDPKSARFVNDFLDQWLDLRDIDFTSPDHKLYPEFRNDLRDAMLLETRAYFREMIDKDLGAKHIIDSEFLMVNQRLAELYGIPDIVGCNIRRVEKPKYSPRGGFLTQAAVLKVTANGTTTSPVKRGAWIMDRVLGTPAPLPPPNIPAVDPDLRGTTTIREQLDKHRADPVCASCHKDIDPPGFALESFDVMGRWRERYRFPGEKVEDPSERKGDDPIDAHFLGALPHHWKHLYNNVRLGLPVDPTGQTPEGEKFSNIQDYKTLLLKHEETIARSLANRLVLYATGSPVTFSDRNEVDKILLKTKGTGYGLRSLIQELAASPFLRKK